MNRKAHSLITPLGVTVIVLFGLRDFLLESLELALREAALIHALDGLIECHGAM